MTAYLKLQPLTKPIMLGTRNNFIDKHVDDFVFLKIEAQVDAGLLNDRVLDNMRNPRPNLTVGYLKALMRLL